MSRLGDFAEELREQFFNHWSVEMPGDEILMPLWYRPGDYSRAALAVLKAKELA